MTGDESLVSCLIPGRSQTTHVPRCPTLQAGPCAICLGNEAAPGSQRRASR
ncbi:hypothetical protein CSOJ01_03273 [Colletotrichum sojae]|uniref:Uncharacterized protein n=1 Tax=Colletotrichum sojae TaxID=2175907 RepID=A0A8H6N0F4_9PEZI|nr:hypothetical protein CSOJ01_03273 [Colletotrichum sojae]